MTDDTHPASTRKTIACNLPDGHDGCSVQALNGQQGHPITSCDQHQVSFVSTDDTESVSHEKEITGGSATAVKRRGLLRDGLFLLERQTNGTEDAVDSPENPRLTRTRIQH